ncbi:MAG: 50S ribosomal protein L23 [Candidatus Aenigmarchaeota archaeon]|nr:50S ribosomal protein L23 [Candidatus Aenigmarchaeota archaeon]
MVSFWELVEHPVTSEKAVRLIESENKLIFKLKVLKTPRMVVKQAFEEEFKVKVEKVNTLIDRTGSKKAIVKLKPESPAGDIAVKLGVI